MSAASDRAQTTPDVLGELNHVRGRVREQLGELLDTLDGDGARYADTYAAWLISRGARDSLAAPPAPEPLRGPAAVLLRELVRDEVTSVRLYGVPA